MRRHVFARERPDHVLARFLTLFILVPRPACRSAGTMCPSICPILPPREPSLLDCDLLVRTARLSNQESSLLAWPYLARRKGN